MFTSQVDSDLDELVSKPSLIASMLDLRHKHLSFLAYLGRAKGKLQEMVTSVGMTAADEPAAGATSRDEDTPMPAAEAQAGAVRQLQCHSQGNAQNAMLMLLGDDYNPPEANDPEIEVDHYLRETSPLLDTNPIDWLKLNRERFETGNIGAL